MFLRIRTVVASKRGAKKRMPSLFTLCSHKRNDKNNFIKYNYIKSINNAIGERIMDIS